MEARRSGQADPQLAKGGMMTHIQREGRRGLFIPPWVRELRLRPPELSVFVNLWSRADRDGWSYPSAERIATDCRINRDTVWVVLKLLEERGLIRRVRVSGRNQYQVLVPGGALRENFGCKTTSKVGGNGRPRLAETEGLMARKRGGAVSAEMEGLEGIPRKAVSDSTSAPQEPSAGTDSREGGREPVRDECGVWDRSETGQPARPVPDGWPGNAPPIHRRRKWRELTPAEQQDCWRRVDPAHPAADYDGWPGHVAGRAA
jgi:hypothetical protein